MKKKLHKKARYLLILPFFIFTIAPTFAQGFLVKGTVFDESGQGMPGVTVLVKGTSTGAATDRDGKYELKAPAGNATLVFTFVGYRSQELAINNRSTVNVTLDPDSKALDEVVVIGYGTTKRKDLTGSVASIDAEKLKDIPAVSVLQAISGRLAGVNITIPEGSPDADVKVRVRGGGSITQDNSPLYIVDGFQVSNINDIPVGDIETIDVLKDASSTAIYGAQGANGVVLVTTKSGKSGKSEINFNTYVGVSQTYKLTDVLSPYEYVYYQKELDPGTSITSTSFYNMYGLWDDLDIYKSNPGIDWQDQLYGNTGVQKNYNLGFTGGEKTLSYNLNYTHDEEDYIMLNSTYKRDYFSAKLTKKISPKLSLDFNSRMANTVIAGPSISSGRKLRDGVKYAPVRSLSFLTESALGGADDVTSAEALSSLNDPIYNIVNEYKNQHRFNLTFNAGLNWDITKGLKFSTRGSYSFDKDFTDNIWLRNTGEASANGGQPVARRTDEKGIRWSFQNVLSYDLNLNKDAHRFSFVLGQEMINSENNRMLSESKFFPNDFSADEVLAMWNYGTPQPTYTTIGEPSRTSSFFGRMNYTFKDRYIFTLTSRADGKNVFAPGMRWGLFPGGAFAWRLSDESFMQPTKDWLSDAKVRVSYGEVGNARVGSYWRQQYGFVSSSRSLYYIDEKPQSALATASVLKNENLTWETTVSTNLGLDLGFFNNRYTVSLDAYENTTKDLILAVALPSNSGYSTQYQNIGSTSNKGLELSASGYIIEKKDFSLSANFNIAFNRNQILALDGSDQLIASSGWGVGIGSDDYRAIVGQPVGLMYGYVVDGFYTFDDFNWDDTQKKWILKEGVVDASSVITTSGNYFGPGHIKLKKLSGEGTKISPDEDRTVIGKAQPKHTGGFTLNTAFKGFDLSAMFNWSYGNDIYNADKIDNTTFTGSKRYQNLSSIMALSERFTTIDPVTGNNIMYGNNADPDLLRELNANAQIWSPITNSSVLTNWAIEDGSFLRLSNLSLGYTLPTNISKRMLMQRLRVYVAGYNLKVWTNYTGQDPEVDTRRSTPLTPGVGYSAYPKAKKLLFGLNVTF
ncbi:SusC/RagA family TonB-linked outer membrane protein [Pontibacter beigongshangensis]|uniref:SusC/RagA family TonB-linked outer membrane protein n=1 Tax=Pontibacter beigongshangensis TaxID=2574733 RepID=UPI00164EF79F|nr:TonB-dependent receptor [Pontibacter beigongshangensis]